MEVKITGPAEKRWPTFADVAIAELFIFAGNVYFKFNRTQAMMLGDHGEVFPINRHEQVNLVAAVAVTPSV